jgi:hypothetical protein
MPEIIALAFYTYNRCATNSRAGLTLVVRRQPTRLVELTGRGVVHCFARLELAAGKFPQPAVSLVDWALRDEKSTVGFGHGRINADGLLHSIGSCGGRVGSNEYPHECQPNVVRAYMQSAAT